MVWKIHIAAFGFGLSLLAGHWMQERIPKPYFPIIVSTIDLSVFPHIWSKEEYLQYAEVEHVSCGGKKFCHLKNNQGGSVVTFLSAALEIKKNKKTLVLEGDCVSACTLIADFIQESTCIMKGTILKYHKASDNSVPPFFSDFTNKFIESQGGWPDYGDRLVSMDYKTAALHWKTCNFRTLLLR